MAVPSNTKRFWLRRRQRYSARPFALTIAVVCFLSLIAWAKHGQASTASLFAGSALSKRGVLLQDQECRLVHQATDKCAFVLANCPDEETGIFSYLSLYYCRLPNAKPVAFVILVLWLALLFSTIGIAASDFFCINLSTIASSLGMSESMAGVTFLAFGNGSPDVFSTFAAMSTNSASLAIGELVGAACFITAVVAGSMALVRPFKVARRSFIRDVTFFTVAASFSMIFIWDGKLHLWESATMVGFYVFYVCFVMVWHWWLGRRKARRLRSATMRSHYIMPGGDEEEISQPYHDEDDGPSTEGGRTPQGGGSAEDFFALEQADAEDSLEGDDNEQARERWLGELSNNMRVSRPPMGIRRNTHTPIRPSLVGALEFRAVLSSLQKSRNHQSIPINLRRYSDDPTFTSAQQQSLIITTADPAPRPPYDVASEASDQSPRVVRPSAEVQAYLSHRTRAVSTNDIDNTRLDPNTLRQGTIPSIEFVPSSFEGAQMTDHAPPSPSISLSPPPSGHNSRSTSPASPRVRHQSGDRLAPPDAGPPSLLQGSPNPSPSSSPVLDASSRSVRPSPKLTVPGMSPPVPFPAYTDYPFPSPLGPSRAPSLRLPSPSASPDSFFHGDPFLGTNNGTKLPRWWPSRLLPPPYVLLFTLFPTLANWGEKYIWEKILGIVAAPSVFLLTVTLPVVEAHNNDANNDRDISPSLNLPGPSTPVNGSVHAHQRSMVTILEPDNASSEDPSAPKFVDTDIVSGAPKMNMTITGDQQPHCSVTATNILQSPEQLPAAVPSSSEPTQWNRWLVIIQAFTAPFFIVFIVWANTELESPRALLKPTLYSLLFSLSMLAVLLTTTTPDRPPRWRTLMCYLGFAVSIAWISSIANEVVGVLKTLGVILNMSDAILGLTIFAVGNSLGDFVADITVARLGFPVMALSACFGGPMLNILLGIGISGCYITIKNERRQHEKHPERPVHFKPYHINVSTTLIISGATLLFTLIGLLVAVPCRKWKMDKTIGWGLVAIWTTSTVVNVVAEVAGWGGNLG